MPEMSSLVGGAVAGKLCEMSVMLALEQISKQISLVVNFREDFEWLKKELAFFKGFLNDADQQCSQRESVKMWLQDVRDVALRAEDLFERGTAQPLYTNRVRSVFTGNLGFLCKMVLKISKLKSRIKSLIKVGRILRIVHDNSSGEEASSSTMTFRRAYSKRSSTLPVDSHPVGRIEAKIEHLASLLDKPTISVIAVTGMGGVGKTFLLQHLYNFAKARFDKAIWLSISQTFSVSKLQHDIASHLDLKDEIRGVTEQRAEELINEILGKPHMREKRILVVLDDVWECIEENNLIQRLGLRIGHNCKLVITSRNRKVCRNVKNIKIYEMECLTEEESWRLFCVYGFPEHGGNTRATGYLMDVARNVAEECGNLPLAIKATAASLAGVRDLSEWDSKLRQLKEVSGLSKPLQVLKLSYDCLPARLRACFAYLSFFPEDEKIDCEYLVNLWIAEGFVPEGEDKRDLGWNCLYELANLCLVQVVEEQLYDYKINVGLNKYCMVHDLFRDLAVHISKENKCAFEIEDAFTNDSFRKNSVDRCRVLLPKKMTENNVMAKMVPAFCPKRLRTLSLYENYMYDDTAASKHLKNMKMLRVLDLSGSGIKTLPACVEDMKLLKVLNLSRTQIDKVPGCVRRLRNLRFLDVSFCSILRQIPAWIGELKCLEHINVLQSPPVHFLNYLPRGFCNLQSLRTPRSHCVHLSVQGDEELKLEDVGNMTQLQEISISLHKQSQLQCINRGVLRKLKKMRHLAVENSIKNNARSQRAREDVQAFPVDHLEIMRHLETLRLQNFAVTSSLCRFANLKELRLVNCEWSSCPEFQIMPNLVSLWLESCERCREIPRSFGMSGAFPELRFLLIEDFSGLKEFPELEDGAMPRLEVFKLLRCPCLTRLKGLEKLIMLKEFNYRHSFRLWPRFKEGGQDWREVKARNPLVIITDR